MTERKTEIRIGQAKESARRDHISKADVLEAAKRLFASQGYQQTSTRQIARESGLKSGSIYHHFRTKEEILHSLLSSYAADIIPAFRHIVATAGGPRETFRDLFSYSLHVPVREPHLSSIALNEWILLNTDPAFSYVQRTWAEARAIWRDVFARGVADGVFRSDLDIRYIVQTVTALVASVARDRARFEWPIDDLIEAQTKMILQGLEPEKKRYLSSSC